MYTDENSFIMFYLLQKNLVTYYTKLNGRPFNIGDKHIRAFRLIRPSVHFAWKSKNNTEVPHKNTKTMNA